MMDLILTSFGLFRGKTFPLNQLTIFFGANESGKSTLFDAIVSSLIKVAGNTAYGKRLKERYGDQRTVKLKDVDPSSVTPGKFLNSYAIREGRIALSEDPKDTGDLIDSIEKTLFSSGLSGKNLKDKCIELSSQNGSKKAGKELKRLTELVRLKTEEFKKADSERKLIFSQFSDLPSKEKVRADLETNIQRTKNKLDELQKEKASLELREKFLKQRETLDKVLLWESKESATSSIQKKIESGKEQVIRTHLDQTLQLESTLKSLSEQILSSKEELNRLKTKLHQSENEKNQKLKYESLVFEIDEQIERITTDVAPTKTTVQWNLLSLVIGGISSFLGLGLGIFSFVQSLAVHWLIVSIFLIVFGLVLLLRFSQKQTISVDYSLIEEQMVRLADQLLLRSDGSIQALLKTKQGIRDAIGKFKQSLTILNLAFESIKNQIQELEAKIDQMSLLESKTKIDITALQNSINEILKEFGVGTYTEFQDFISDAKSKLVDMQHITAQLRAILPEVNVTSVNLLKVKLKDEISSLEASGVSERFESKDLERLKEIRQLIEKETLLYDQLKEQNTKISSELAHSLGGYQASMKTVLERFDQSRIESDMAKIALESFHKTMKAYENLTTIFDEMDSSVENEMTQLVVSLSKRWKELLPGEGGREIEWNQLTEEAKTHDTSGSLRAIDHLSTGTKELFYFALRLEYALRISEEDGLRWLLLDEPFRHMDEMRLRSATAYTIQYLKQKGWNGVVFTFDSELRDTLETQAREVGLPCTVHNLS